MQPAEYHQTTPLLTILNDITHSSFKAVPCNTGYALSGIICSQITRANLANHMGQLFSAQRLL